MPKTNLDKFVTAKKMKPNYWREMIKAAEKSKKYTSTEIGEKVGEDPATVRRRVSRHPSLWKVDDILAYCRVLDIDPRDAWEIILKSC